MVYEGEQQGAEVVARRLVGLAVKKVFDARFPEVGKETGGGGEDDKGPYARMIRWFAEGNAITISDVDGGSGDETVTLTVASVTTPSATATATISVVLPPTFTTTTLPLNKPWRLALSTK